MPDFGEEAGTGLGEASGLGEGAGDGSEEDDDFDEAGVCSFSSTILIITGLFSLAKSVSFFALCALK